MRFYVSRRGGGISFGILGALLVGFAYACFYLVIAALFVAAALVGLVVAPLSFAAAGIIRLLRPNSKAAPIDAASSPRVVAADPVVTPDLSPATGGADPFQQDPSSATQAMDPLERAEGANLAARARAADRQTATRRSLDLPEYRARAGDREAQHELSRRNAPPQASAPVPAPATERVAEPPLRPPAHKPKPSDSSHSNRSAPTGAPYGFPPDFEAQAGPEVVEMLKKRLRAADSQGVTSGTSTEAGWQYLRFAGRVSQGIANHEPAYQIYVAGGPFGPQRRVDDPNALGQRTLDRFKMSARRVSQGLAAFDGSGDAESIDSAADQIVAGYWSILSSALDLRSAIVSPRWGPVLKAASDFASRPLDQIRMFASDMAVEFEDYVAELQAGNAPSLPAMKLVLTIDPMASRKLSQAVEAARAWS